MYRIALIPVLFALACLIAGAYGALHNQISYTVSPEYFTQFKFHQFGIINLPPRFGAAVVGWSAAWWMGIVIGIVLIPLGYFRIPGNAARFFRRTMSGFIVVALVTLVTGLCALAAAYLLLKQETVGEITRYGNEIVDDLAFARAGTMHNFSYLGGLIGILFGCRTIINSDRSHTIE